MPKNGYVSASETKSLLVNGNGPGGFGVGALTYARKLARQIVGVSDEDDYKSRDMERGIEFEDNVGFLYAERYLVQTIGTGWIQHPEIEWFGGTPDWLIGSDGGIDAKCPNNDNHHQNITNGMQLADYKHQFQSYMAITGRQWWELVSYNMNFPEPIDLAVFRMERDEKYIDNLCERVVKFRPIVLEYAEELKTLIKKG